MLILVVMMGILSKILIPIDFSERCLGAARFAIPLAERFHSQITFLHVAPAPGADWDLNAERDEQAKKQLRDFLCAAFTHLDVERVLRTGSPAREIVAYAHEDRSDTHNDAHPWLRSLPAPAAWIRYCQRFCTMPCARCGRAPTWRKVRVRSG